jgi:hypothetical protein
MQSQLAAGGKALHPGMKPRYALFFSLVTLIEGILVEVGLWQMTFDVGRGQILHYATIRLALSGLAALTVLALAVFAVGLFARPAWGSRLSAFLDGKLVGTKKRLFFVQGVFLVAALFFFESFLLTYLAFPVPTRPVFVWAVVVCLQAWLVLRIAYVDEYRRRPSVTAILRAKWNGWQPVQRKGSLVVAALGLVYFLAFVPVNLYRDDTGQFYVQGDENILYPDVTQALVTQDTFSGDVHAALESWPWQYGYLYLTASALVLLIPRLVFGNQFANHIALNIFLLRQFVSVLPMVLTLVLAVYLVTRFKSVLKSAGMFAFLALVPGIVKYNHQFWHPDALIVLLIMLTIYFLRKDDLRFGRYFYLAAVACGLATAIKLWGVFFFLAIAGTLLAGLLQKKLTVRRAILSGIFFLFAMFGAIILSSPSLMAPYIARVALRGWLPRQSSLLTGYDPDTSGFYDTGLANWLKFFGYHYMKGYFFYFSFFALIVGSLWSARAYLNRILLGWCAVTAIFLAYFVALKNFQYMLPLAVPLYCAAFLFPEVTDVEPKTKWQAFLAKTSTRKAVWGVTLVLLASQLVVNLVILGLYIIRGG